LFKATLSHPECLKYNNNMHGARGELPTKMQKYAKIVKIMQKLQICIKMLFETAFSRII